MYAALAAIIGPLLKIIIDALTGAAKTAYETPRTLLDAPALPLSVAADWNRRVRTFNEQNGISTDGLGTGPSR